MAPPEENADTEEDEEATNSAYDPSDDGANAALLRIVVARSRFRDDDGYILEAGRISISISVPKKTSGKHLPQYQGCKYTADCGTNAKVKSGNE